MESFPNQKPERNIESDRNSFIEAMSSTSIEEIPTNFDEQAVKEFTENLESNKLFILGEIHGVKENADIIYTLFKKFGFRQLALEWKPELMDTAKTYIQSGELDFDAIKESPDGRITAQYFALIKKLQSEGILTKLICFNEGSGGHGWNVRDAAMAQNILGNLSDVPTLVVAGKLHTKTEPLSFDDEPGEHYPMALNIKRVIPDVASGAIEYLSGHYHNYGVEEFSTTSDQTIPTQAKFYKNKEGLFIFQLPKATAATVPHPSDRI